MNIIIAETLTLIGEITIAYTVVKVHYRVMKEHKIDDNVLNIMKKEQMLAIVGVCLIIGGYIFNILEALSQ